ncbi:methylmalonyl-CoA mutase family protein [Streptomyces griseoviridis]|jgi:methylmalonyl-CoA mutase|uniref:methylmalonyl-CoA mutase n=3 Tax=Streptomyces TaxID=1883 RepID=A0A918GU40_STRGD|nr:MULTISPECIES: methylmalonyl-CoA mutase family protein [Streptomyces]MDP9684642.1 methylmalonyl-CoA mutase [Streptomyces griseoviridis]GGS63777.1 methylmalonyl-CoA mutase [Streptomyces niveoruber]GGT21083.1 methylmalonyl-CoA mutase [Streptomyces griseoviridis]GGU62005.1 methylmalonyl-CoA mutase [Streptomyces daghestanicus]GHI30404.1 methylmalonyl-CoA mutase [Streptomyces daghestanicus]
MTVLPDDRLPLAAEFPDATHEQWQHLVAGVLRKSGKEVSDAEAEQTLSTALEDGLRVRPLYTARDAAPDPGLPGFAPFVRGGRAAGHTPGGWDVRQRHTVADPAAVLADLENGVGSLWLAVGAGGGFPVASLGHALDGVLLDLAPVALDAGAETGPAARALFALYEERGVAAGAVRGTLGADPLGHGARTGEPYAFAAVAQEVLRCADAYPGLRAMTVDALPYHEAGGSAAQELGCALATGVAYLRELTAAGLSAGQALGQLEFRYAATADQFLTIAKLRAARRLWARVAEVCGAPGAGAQLQHVVTSPVMMARRDPWVNMLRTTVAALAAGVGGADAVTVLPFDHALGLPDAFARRIARNTSTILIEESHLARVIDPAGGSWYVERLTDELAHAAWEFFQEIERSGGQAAALRSGLVGDRLAATWAERSKKLATRREPVTGVSEFPHLAEQPVVRDPAPRPPSGGLPRVRRDEAFEALRARSDAHLAATGARPRIHLAALGPAAAHTARLSFAANLFQAGGIETVTEGPFEESGAREACLCSSDAVYGEQAESAAAALRERGAGHVFLAGRPGPYAGVDTYVFAGCDAVAVLSATLDRMGVS